MSRYVVDASVAIKWFLLEIHSEAALRLRSSRYRKELQHLPLQRHADDRLFPTSYPLALDTQRSVYDSLYLALAEAVDGIMVTADRNFYSSLAGGTYGSRVLWVVSLSQLT